MEITGALWRAGLDNHGYYMTEDVCRVMVQSYKETLPQPFDLEFNPSHRVGDVIDIWYDEDEMMIFVKVELPQDQANKWTGFPIEHSLRPSILMDGMLQRAEDVLVREAKIIEVSMAVISRPSPFPIPPPAIRGNSWME